MNISMAMLGGFAVEYQRKIKDRKPQKARNGLILPKAQDQRCLYNCAGILGACTPPKEEQIVQFF